MFVIGLFDAVLNLECLDYLSEDNEHFFVVNFLGLKELGQLFTELSRWYIPSCPCSLSGDIDLDKQPPRALVDLINHFSKNTSYWVRSGADIAHSFLVLEEIKLLRFVIIATFKIQVYE